MQHLRSSRIVSALVPLALLVSSNAQREQHGRAYKPPPPTANVQVMVEKAANDKPMPSTSVIFRAVRDDHSNGNLEMKTDANGRANIDLLEVGSRVTVQVIAPGYATFATDFDLTSDGKQLLVKLQRPRAQVSAYGEGQDQPSQVQPGVQEHHVGMPAHTATVPATTLPAPASPTGPLQTTPPANTPATVPGSGTPTTPGSPQ